MCAMLSAVVCAQEGEVSLNKQYHEAIIEYLNQDVKARQKEMQKRAQQMLTSLPNNQKLYDETKISVRTSLAEGQKEDGSAELNLVYNISYNCRHLEGITDDYALGMYAWDSSNSCRAICTLTKTFVETMMDDIFRAGKHVSVRIHSTTDGTEFVGVIPYKGEYGDFRYCPVTFNGEDIRISVDTKTGIRNNAQLAYIRAQSIKQFLENDVRNLQRTANDWKIITQSFSDTGAQLRRSSIELIVHDAFSERIQTMTADKIQDEYVDFNIPLTMQTYDNAYVLIIANEDYDNTFLPTVPYAANDGDILKQYFVRSVGVPERQVKVLHNASKATIINDGIKWLTDLSQAVAGKGANVQPEVADIYVYFAGHGIVGHDGQAYLLPNSINADGIAALQGKAKKGCSLKKKSNQSADGSNLHDITLSKKEMNRLTAQCIAIDTLCSMLRGKDKRNLYPINRLTLIVDASFDGRDRTDKPMLRADKLPFQDNNGKKAKRKANKNSDAIVLLAAAYNKTAFAYDTQHHGFMTYFLLKEIKAQAGQNDNLTYGDIYESVQRNVNKESALQGKWQEVSGFVDGKYIIEWKQLKLK